MFFKNKLIKDTILLTFMQLFLDTASLLLNVFITRQLGASAIGILSLTGSFLGLAGILSNGNAFLCTSRLVSEEMGKSNSNPNKILTYAIKLCLILSITVSIVIFMFAEPLSNKFFSGANMKDSIKFMPLALISGAIASCFKGYFNACRKASTSAKGDIIEFIIKSLIIVVMTVTTTNPDENSICRIMIAGIITGNIFSLIYCLIIFFKNYKKCSEKCSLNFRKYMTYAFPIMGGSILTSVLSSMNDALIPMCLKQNGDSVNEALSRFGIFEAIVIPTLFFPSVILCSMSGIVVSESARATASKNNERIKSLTERLTKYTLIFAIYASAVLMYFGKNIGEIMGGGNLAGKMITIIAPVVPFIYMEIILEALIKGMGLQSFSSLNYLIEYVIRISIVLIFVPKFGFYGIVASYYSSNVIGNCARFIKIIKHTKASFKPFRIIFVPILYAFLTLKTVELLTHIFIKDANTIPEMIIFIIIWSIMYFGVFAGFNLDSFQFPNKKYCSISTNNANKNNMKCRK